MRNRAEIAAIAMTVILMTLILTSCGAKEPKYKLVRLPSGTTIKVLSVGTMQFTQGEPALMLKYETDHAITDVAALEAEADEVWQAFRVDVENARMSNAIISATSRPTGGFISHSQSYNFVFQKSQDGTWKRLPNK